MTWCRLGLQNINQWCNRNGWLFIICSNFRGILELEQNRIKQIHSLERSGHSRHNIIEVFYRWAWFWTNGKQQKVYSKYWNQKHRSSSLFHGNICDATTGVACICDCAGAGVTGQWKINDKKVVSWKLSNSSPEFCSLNDENFGEEDNVQDYDDDDWNSEKPIAVTQIHPAMVILECLILLNIQWKRSFWKAYSSQPIIKETQTVGLSRVVMKSLINQPLENPLNLYQRGGRQWAITQLTQHWLWLWLTYLMINTVNGVGQHEQWGTQPAECF